MSLYLEDGYVNDGYVNAGVYIDWASKIIHVPRTDMLLIQTTPSEIRELDLDKFRLDLKALEAGVEGMAFLDTHSHNPPVTVGGVTLARVVEIINGYTVTFEDGQYAVNLVGANSNVADVTNVNQVSVRSANSAGLTYSKEIEDQSFYDSRIFIDTIIGQTGTQFPRGTPGDPVNNQEDATAIINNRGLGARYWLRGHEVINTSHDMRGEDWLGVDASLSIVELAYTHVVGHTTPGTFATIFNNVTITGSANGPFSLKEGTLDDVTNWEGSAENSGIVGTLTLAPGVSDDLYTLIDCHSLVPGQSTPILDGNNAIGTKLQMRDYVGGITLANFTDPGNEISIDLASGHVVLDSTVTEGVYVIRGVGYVTDNSTGNAMVMTDGLTPVWSESEKDATLVALTGIADTITLLQKYEENRTVIDKLNNTLTVYDDDDITPILTFSLRDSTGTPSTDEVAERVPQ